MGHFVHFILSHLKEREHGNRYESWREKQSDCGDYDLAI